MIQIAPFALHKWIKKMKNWKIAPLVKNTFMLSVSMLGRIIIQLVLCVEELWPLLLRMTLLEN
jgi:hypothetical protein